MRTFSSIVFQKTANFKGRQLLKMPLPSPFMEWVGRIAFEATHLRPFLPTYLHLLASALFPIYVGAHASLSIPSSAAPPAKKERGAPHDDFADEEPEVVAEKIEGLTPKDAILFPLLAGLTLSSLYFIIKWLEDPSILNKILSYYFMQVGLVFGTKFIKDALTVIRSFCLPRQYAQGGLVWRVNSLKQRYDVDGSKAATREAYHVSPFPGQFGRLPLSRVFTDAIWRIRGLLYAKCSLNFHIHRLVTLKVPVDLLDAFAITTSVAVVNFFTFLYKPWYVSNLLGFAFCYGSTQYMSPTTFWTGTLLLSALFFYDVYFVFFTPMMVTVATRLDIPIKLLFPRPPSPTEIEKGLPSLSMLGLGDIVIPGMMIALALRFDLYLHYLRKSTMVEGKMEKSSYIPVTGGWGERFWVGKYAANTDLRAKAFSKTYFWAGLMGYALGMIVTLLVMQIAQHAQPALLYLVPGVLTALWGTAAWKDDLNQMWNYNENKEADKHKKPSERRKDKGEEDTNQEVKDAEDSEKGAISAREGEARDSAGDGSQKRQATGTEESTPTSSTTEEGSECTPASEEDIQSSSSKCVSESDSDSDFDTESSSQSERRQRPKQEKSKTFKNQKEEKCRHLIWFSIDFPPPPPSTELSGLAKSSEDAWVSTVSPSVGVEDGDREGKGIKKPTNGGASPADREPPGKKRRVK
jgi:minor histocompatibility antigen H13